jgi:hypothetical protein
MSTRSGKDYTKGVMASKEKNNSEVNQLVELLLEDRRLREAEGLRKEETLKEERERCEREHSKAAARREEEGEDDAGAVGYGWTVVVPGKMSE